MIKFFITGTGTDVGKTFIAAGISWQICQNSQKPFTYIKPVASGVDEINGDIEFVKKSIQKFSFAKTEGWFSYKEPASPYIAARAENKILPYQEILNRIKNFNSKEENLIVEGAGGVLVPLTKEKMVIDLIEEINLPVLVVGHVGLGTVNHSCLTIETLKKHKCQILGVVLNQVTKIDNEEFALAVATNKAEIERITGIPVLGVIPNGEPFNGANFENLGKSILHLL